MSKKPFGLLFSVLILTLVSAVAVFSQGTTSRLTGTVTDSSGAAVSGATVTLTNEGTGISLTTETADSGAYTFDLIQAGSYQVTVERQGFKKTVTSKNTVFVNQPATVNVALEVGGVAETVTVEGTAEVVQTSSSGNLGSTVDQRTLESLPIVGNRGRNPLDLLNFQPGVINTFGVTGGGGVHVHGSRDRAFNFTLDSIQEFQVVTSNFTAELGRSSGAQITFITRSGTNRLTGNAFEYYRTPRFNANEYGNNLNGRERPQFVQHIFGGSLGGPIIKDKFFFFTNLQMLRSNDSVPITRTVYTQAARNGIFRYVRGGQNSPTGTTNASVDGAGNPLIQPCSATLTTGCLTT